MPLRRTKRSDGRPRPRWKDGSHEHVENKHANESRTDEIALEPNHQTESLVTTPLLFQRNYENPVSTRDRIAKAGADARIEESMASAKVRLALRPYGRRKKPPFSTFAGYGRYVKSGMTGDRPVFGSETYFITVIADSLFKQRFSYHRQLLFC